MDAKTQVLVLLHTAKAFSLIFSSRLYVHHTCATDTDQMQYVFDACADIILQTVLNEIGLM